jgi:hypothetical protein
MAPSFMRRDETTPELDDEIKEAIISHVRSGSVKPWTVVSEVSGDEWSREEVRETLRKLTLRGEITPTADGDLRVSATEA